MVKRVDKSLRRREFLGCLAAGFAVAALPACAGIYTYHAQSENGRILLSNNELPSGENSLDPVLIRVPEVDGGLLLIRRNPSALIAIGARCTHQGCQVRPGGDFFTCPCHGSTFDLDGAVVRGPAQKPLPRYPVIERDGLLEIVIT